MVTSAKVCFATAISAIFLIIQPALAQNAITAPASKTIGAAKTEIVPSLIVLNARGATLRGELFAGEQGRRLMEKFFRQLDRIDEAAMIEGGGAVSQDR